MGVSKVSKKMSMDWKVEMRYRHPPGRRSRSHEESAVRVRRSKTEGYPLAHDTATGMSGSTGCDRRCHARP